MSRPIYEDKLIKTIREASEKLRDAFDGYTEFTETVQAAIKDYVIALDKDYAETYSKKSREATEKIRDYEFQLEKKDELLRACEKERDAYSASLREAKAKIEAYENEVEMKDKTIELLDKKLNESMAAAYSSTDPVIIGENLKLKKEHAVI